MKKDKKKPSDIKKNRLQGLDARSGQDALKKDVGLTDKKGDNLRREDKKEDLDRSDRIQSKKGPRR